MFTRICSNVARASWLVLLSLAVSCWGGESPCSPTSEESRYLHRYLNGDASARAKAAFSKSLAKWGDEPTVQQILEQPVTSIGAGNFNASDLAFTLIRPDGGLVRPPAVDCGEGADLYGIAVRFALQWRTIAQAILCSEPVSAAQIEFLRAPLAEWHCSLPVNADFAAVRRLNSAKEYVNKMKTVCDALEQSHRREILESYLRSHGFKFQGGSVGRLALFVVDFGLAPIPGSEAHARLSELVQRLVCLEEEAHQERLEVARAERQRRAELREAQYDRQAQRIAVVLAAQQAYLAEYNRYRQSYYRVYSVPTTRTYTRTYTYSVPR